MTIITSRTNPKIKKLHKLKQKKYRDSLGEFIIEGTRSIEIALTENQEIESIFVDSEYQFKLHDWLVESGLANHGNFNLVEGKLLKEVFDTVAPQGILAVVKYKKLNLDELMSLTTPKVILLDRIQDPGNLGTIIRTADAAGYDTILCTKGCADLYNPKTVRATMGSILNVKIYDDLNQSDVIDFLKINGYTIISSTLEGGMDYTDIQKPVRFAVVFGNEGSGIDPQILKNSDLKVKIPILGKAESLNVSVAAGILIYYFGV
ncbi:TrmH family RNA methyltransferase [Alkalibacter mobilis]|uniref:TrmH family RNA methyltransferase n=1 Tax=Alkalibacter mobilis TaxID=2787712 RepID=UPI0018A01B31|nr:RNA methyltransferase [Alkalibacter mobilis]MBF7097093.1 RNA methyltransferase [Alkalibacter mobilis]